jgi:hypothetical protein
MNDVFVKIKDGVVAKFPYDEQALQEDNPYTNFASHDIYQSFQGTEQNLLGFTLERVKIEDRPVYDDTIQTARFAEEPVLIDGVWTLKWVFDQK